MRNGFTWSLLSALPRLPVLLAFGAIYFVWGSTFLATRYAVETLPPFLMGGARFTTAGVALYLLVRLSGGRAPRAARWRTALVSGSVLFGVGYGALAWAQQSVPSGAAALLYSLMPAWMVLLDWLIWGRPRPDALRGLGLVLGSAGVALIVGRASSLDGAALDLAPTAALVAAPLAWAWGSLYARRSGLLDAPLLAAAMQMLAGGAFLLVLGLLVGEHTQFDPSRVAPRSILSFAYLVLGGSLLAFTAYVWLLGVTSPARVATYSYVNPVVAVVLGFLVAGEGLSGSTVIGGVLIVVAVAIISTQGSHNQTSPADARAKAIRGAAGARAR